MQIHWPVTEPQKKGDRIDPSVKETWTALEKLVDEVLPLISGHAASLLHRRTHMLMCLHAFLYGRKHILAWLGALSLHQSTSWHPPALEKIEQAYMWRVVKLT